MPAQPPRLELSKEQTTCRQPRPYPAGATATQADVAAALTDAHLSWEDCSGKLSRIQPVVDAYNGSKL